MKPPCLKMRAFYTVSAFAPNRVFFPLEINIFVKHFEFTSESGEDVRVVPGPLGPSVQKTSCFSQFLRARETTHFCSDYASLVFNSEKIVTFYMVLGPALLKTHMFLTIRAVTSTMSCVFAWFLKYAFRKVVFYVSVVVFSRVFRASVMTV